ncbi:DUF3368 domain-containing protein [Pseudomonas sp. NPDC007930]|uniref:DUF3368 domain-containing protein n=1 Tax=Pseudomonas sp. NPDC007930 TaxID=3364417 RepID=UPI0036ED63EA
MHLLISDANILIDLEEGALLTHLFQLPFTFQVPDILFYEELETQHAHLLGLGLTLGELTPETLIYALELTTRVRGPSRNDCFALALARQQRCHLLSGDMALRKLAKAEAVPVNGTLWVVEQMVAHSIISLPDAEQAYARMRASARRLPWDLVQKSLEALKAAQ